MHRAGPETLLLMYGRSYKSCLSDNAHRRAVALNEASRDLPMLLCRELRPSARTPEETSLVDPAGKSKRRNGESVGLFWLR